ncbi:MAG: hypothetical protein JW726_02260 [Anaerolineales bacterium]|nr:hypothetical protein [Anaerolineales bacterium]
MRVQKVFILALLVCTLLFTTACVYIVLPEGWDLDETAETSGWSAAVTNIGQSDAGDLHIDITIRNETGNWSAMNVVEGKPAMLETGDGETIDCETVMVSTGGHRLAPGFQMRGYTGGTKAEPMIQLLYVECQGAEAAEGEKLTIDYVYYTGELDYYHQDANQASGTLELDLDEIATDLTYPIYEPVEGLIRNPDVEIPAISDNVVTLLDVQRTETGFQFTWQNYNPTNFALKTHIGTPPVIGEDGIIYGVFQIMDLVSVPITSAGGTAEWTTETAVPQDVNGFYILLSVESKQMRLYVNHVIDISDR